MTHPQHIYIQPEPPAPLPDPLQCERLATNQIGIPPDLGGPITELPAIQGVTVWTGADSGATGIHQQYLYQPTAIPGVYQQWIIMSEVADGGGGAFIDGEELSVS